MRQAGENGQFASRQRLPQAAGRGPHPGDLPLTDEHMDVGGAGGKGFVRGVQGAGPQKRGHVLPRYGAGIPVVVLEQRRLDAQGAELQPREPAFADEPIAASEGRADERGGQPVGDHRRALDERRAADIPAPGEHFQRDLPAQGESAEQRDRPAELPVDEVQQLKRVVYDGGKRAVAASVTVQYGEDHAEVVLQAFRRFPVIPPGQAAAVQEEDGLPAVRTKFTILHRNGLS